MIRRRMVNPPAMPPPVMLTKVRTQGYRGRRSLAPTPDVRQDDRGLFSKEVRNRLAKLGLHHRTHMPARRRDILAVRQHRGEVRC